MELLAALVIAALIILFFVIFSKNFNERFGGSEDRFGCIAVFVVLPLILVSIGSVFIFVSPDPVQVAIFVAVLSALTAAFAWLIKSAKSSVENRAELLIIEALSSKRMTRGEIRQSVYGDSPLFRLYKAAYINALTNLLREDRIVLSDGYYSLSGKKTPPP